MIAHVLPFHAGQCNTFDKLFLGYEENGNERQDADERAGHQYGKPTTLDQLLLEESQSNS